MLRFDFSGAFRPSANRRRWRPVGLEEELAPRDDRSSGSDEAIDLDETIAAKRGHLLSRVTEVGGRWCVQIDGLHSS